MSQTFKLFRLQQIDSQLDRARFRLQEIEHALNENQALHQAQQRFEETHQNLEAARKALRRAEENVQSQRVKIEQTESTLYSGKVRNPKELQDIQNEAAALKRYRSVLEDRQLEVMIALEENEATYATAQADLETIQAQFAQQNQALTEEQSGLREDVVRLESERQATASSIPEDDLRLYNQLRQQRRGIAVARLTPDRACSACGTTLNAALLSAARSPSQITRCSTCGRIIYAQ